MFHANIFHLINMLYYFCYYVKLKKRVGKWGDMAKFQICSYVDTSEIKDYNTVLYVSLAFEQQSKRTILALAYLLFL